MMKRLLPAELLAIVVAVGLALIIRNELRPAWNVFVGMNPPCPTCGRYMSNDETHRVFCTHCDR